MINLEPFDLIAPESTPAMLKQAREQALRRINRLLEAQGLQADRYQIIVGEGAVSEVLLDIQQRHHIDLAVLGTHGRRAFKKLRLGSIAQEVSRTAPCPVLTIGPRTRSVPTNKTLRHILYPLEFAPDSSDAAKYAVSLAQQYTAA